MKGAMRPVSPAAVAHAIDDAIAEATRAARIQHIVISRADGLIISHSLSDADMAKRLAAMSAAIVGTARMATSDLGQGFCREASVRADKGRLVCLQAGDQAIVAGLGPKDANVGLLLLVLTRLAQKVEEIISQWETDESRPP
jgi:predicted regulator of Ras-like GTPase activity (Roadblock/LC7/MglB family)